MGEGAGQADIARGEALLERFLANRGGRTLRAYRLDVEDFARFVGRDPAAALAQVLGAGREAGGRLVLGYAVDLRRRGRAQATVERRLATLRALMRLAHDEGLVDWPLAVPSEEQVSAAVEARSDDGVPYLFPRHPSEADRLDVQHYGLREALGANYLAPIERPARVLDVGCGTGQWGFDLCQQFPDALVVGLDLVPSKPGRPPGYRLVRGNVLQGLPLEDDRFDFVHQRLLVVGVPLTAWPALVSDLARVARPGGWVELVEPIVGVEGAGPATERFNQLALSIAGSMGLDTTSVVFSSLDGYLCDAGLVEVVRRQVSLPIGRWGGRVGSFMATDLRAAYARVSDVLQARSGISAEECRDLMRRAQEECEQCRMSFTFAVAFGRKPGG